MRREGFTLIELMIVVACVGIVVVGGWSQLTAARRAATADHQLLRATTALESELDRVRAALAGGGEVAPGSFEDPELELLTEGAGRRALTPLGPRLVRVVVPDRAAASSLARLALREGRTAVTRAAHERGFTLIELMVSVTIAGLVAGSLGAFFLHFRALGHAIAVDAAQERTARLVVDHLRRDARGASSATLVAGGLSLALSGRTVTYRLGKDGLDRRAGAAELHYPGVARFEPRLAGRSLVVVLGLDRDLQVVQRRRQLEASILLEAR